MHRRNAGLVFILAAGLALVALPAAAADLREPIHAFLSALPADFETIACKTVATKQQVGENIFVLDVREPDEFKAGGMLAWEKDGLPVTK